MLKIHDLFVPLCCGTVVGQLGTRIEWKRCNILHTRHLAVHDRFVCPTGAFMRRTITISVSDEMHSLIHKGMRSRYYSTVSEYIRFLVRRDQMPVASEKAVDTSTMPQTANQAIDEALHETEMENVRRRGFSGFCF